MIRKLQEDTMMLSACGDNTLSVVLTRPQNENLNLVVRFKFLNLVLYTFL